MVWRALCGFAVLLSGAASAAPRLGSIGPAASAADLAPLADLLAQTGWQTTPEFSGVFSPGAVFSKEDGQHRLLATDCVEADAVAHAYPSVDLVRSLRTGVSVRWGVGRARADAELVRRMTFGAPTQETLPRWSVSLTEACRTRLQQLPPGERSAVYLVEEVLKARIEQQTCGRLDARGKLVALGSAEAELAAACAQVSHEPVAVGYRVVSAADLDLGSLPARVQLEAEDGEPGCPWPSIDTVSTTMTTVTLNGETRDVRGRAARTAFVTDLQRCGYPEAARAFERWRANRRATNLAGATVVGVYPFGIGLFTALRAGTWRERTESLLQDPTGEADGARWRARLAGR